MDMIYRLITDREEYCKTDTAEHVRYCRSPFMHQIMKFNRKEDHQGNKKWLKWLRSLRQD